jgi:hypothetical protein
MGEWSYSATILDLGARCGGGVSGNLHAPATLLLQKQPPVPIRDEAG